MLFLTSWEENQNQRAALSELMKALRLIEKSDWALNLHPSGFLYRYLCSPPEVNVLFKCSSLSELLI